MKPTIAVTIGVFLAASLAAAQLRPDQVDRATEWNDWLAREADGFSGVALVARGERIVAAAAFGLADAAGRPNRLETRFNLGSINKTFTAVAVAQLLEGGRLALDDRIIQHVPDYPNRDAAGQVTIRQLLRHTSGIAQFMRPDFGDVSVADMTRLVAAEPLAFDPGTRQMYSNGGYVVLGRVVEVASGRTYADYIAEHIYRRAGMTASGFVRAGDRVEALALPVGAANTGRAGDAGPPQPLSTPRPGNPAGGGYSTAADLFRFAHALRSGRLLGPAMTRYVLEGTFAEDPKWGFALREQLTGSQRFLGNGGGAPGVNAEFRFDPAGGPVAVVLSNSSPPAATSLLTAILNRIVSGPVPAGVRWAASASAARSGASGERASPPPR
jgi:D-alanyl-D-alanine carboxypeptidase